MAIGIIIISRTVARKSVWSNPLLQALMHAEKFDEMKLSAMRERRELEASERERETNDSRMINQQHTACLNR